MPRFFERKFLLPAAGPAIVVLPAMNKGLLLRARVVQVGAFSAYTWGIATSPTAAARLAGAVDPSNVIGRPETPTVVPAVLARYGTAGLNMDVAGYDGAFDLFTPRVAGALVDELVAAAPGIPFESAGDAGQDKQAHELYFYISAVVAARSYYVRLATD